MISLWYEGKYYDSWYNKLDDTDFMEVSMINLGLEPSLCEWVEYQDNPNSHNPKQMIDEEKSIIWMVEEFIPQAIVTDPVEMFSVQKQYLGHKVFKMLARILTQQNELLEANLLEGEEIPAIPTQYADTPVQDKIVVSPKQKLTISESIMSQGQRSVLYTNEKELPPKFKNLTALAKFLLAKPTKWNEGFISKLKFYGDMK